MYPAGRLNELAERRAALQRRIALRRLELAEAALPLEQAVEELAEWRDRLRRWRLFGSVGVGLAAWLPGRRREESDEESPSRWQRALRWAPVAVQAFRLLRLGLLR